MNVMMEKTGYIYVLTNESFHKDNWVKIGYAEDVDKRVKELSNTSVPLPYAVYCTYEIPRIQGVKDPDKLLHDLITMLNPDLRISQNREFFEMLPWDAYNMLLAIAKMHGRMDKVWKNDKNKSDTTIKEDEEYSFESLFPAGSEEKNLYDKIEAIVFSLDSTLSKNVRALYVSYKMGKRNVISIWPKKNWLEIVLNAKLGQIIDENDLIYDISNRKWSSEQYAFKLYRDTNTEAVREIIQQVIDLKKKERSTATKPGPLSD